MSSGKSKLVALDVASHAVRWEQETPKEWTTYRPLITGSVVIVGNDDKDLCAFDRATGDRRWRRPVGQGPRGLGISRDGILYVGSLSGVVQAFREKMKPLPIGEQAPETRVIAFGFDPAHVPGAFMRSHTTIASRWPCCIADFAPV